MSLWRMAMKNKFILIMLFIFSIILISCGNSKKDDKEDNKFNELGFYFKEDLIFTKDDSIDLKDYIVVGDRINENGKSIGKTTYDNLSYEVDSFSTNTLSVDSSGIVTKNNLGNGSIYINLKENEDSYSFYSIIVMFGNDDTFSTWYGYNEYLDLWARNNNETKGTIKLEFNSDFTFKLTLTEGKFGFINGVTKDIEDGVIEGKITSSSGDLYLNNNYNMPFKTTIYYEYSKETYSIITNINVNDSYYEVILFQEERII